MTTITTMWRVVKCFILFSILFAGELMDSAVEAAVPAHLSRVLCLRMMVLATHDIVAIQVYALPNLNALLVRAHISIY